MLSKQELTPQFNKELYQESMTIPVLTWLIVQFIYLIITGLAPVVTGASGFGVTINILFGAWAAALAIREGANIGDATVVALLVGLIAGIIIMIFFGYINPPNFVDYDFGDQLLPQILNTMMQHGIGGLIFANLYQSFKSPSSLRQSAAK